MLPSSYLNVKANFGLSSEVAIEAIYYKIFSSGSSKRFNTIQDRRQLLCYGRPQGAKHISFLEGKRCTLIVNAS